MMETISQRLRHLAFDLWWSWNPAAAGLFAELDPVLWRSTRHSPLEVLAGVDPTRLAALAEDEAFGGRLAAVEKQRREYRDARTWFQRSMGRSRIRIAYLCSEFALHESLPMYSGGLGVLAGDHLKSASDLGIPLVGVGLLYAHGYYRQEILADGSTRVLYPRPDFERWPLQDTGARIRCPLGRREVKLRIWAIQVGRVALYLLDANLPSNRPADRRLTEGLYEGEARQRMEQQVLLGVGGVRALEALGIAATVFHLNEGHAAFCSLERMRREVGAGRTRARALERVRRTTVFTTHTPVPAGHDRYDPAMVGRALGAVLEPMGMSAAELADLGRERPGDRSEQLCMTVLALRTASRVNAVSKIHGEVTRAMWRGVYGAERTADVPIGHVTNGIHSQTWLAPEALPLYRRHLRPRWLGASPELDPWQRAATIPLEELWALRGLLRARLVHFLRERAAEQITRRGGSAAEAAEALRSFDPEALTIGFARRFATYKRAPLVFRDAERLARLLSDRERPVQLIFAGKAHPRDDEGREVARRIFRFSRREAFRGRVLLLEEYDMHIGRLLTSGCDVWLNTPRRPHEASGTSGMKPPLHGGLNCSIGDGWWPEGHDGRNGWLISSGEEHAGEAAQDRADAEALHRLLEEEIVPLFYERGRDGLPRRWLRRARAALHTLPAAFSSHRMVGEYFRDYYAPAHAARARR